MHFKIKQGMFDKLNLLLREQFIVSVVKMFNDLLNSIYTD